MSALNGYWARYDATLARVRAERPSTFAELKAILDTFERPSSGDAFFPSQSADEELWEVLQDAGWRIEWVEGGYWYNARHSVSGARLEFIEGDLYDRTTPASG